MHTPVTKFELALKNKKELLKIFIAYAYNNQIITHHLGPLREGQEADQGVRSTSTSQLSSNSTCWPNCQE